MRTMILRASLCAAALFSAAPVSAQVIVGTASPASGNCIPFGCANYGNRYQEAYAATAFPGVFTINAVDFFHTQSGPGAGVYADGTYNFSFGITSNAPNALSPNQDANPNVSPLQFFASLVLNNTSAAPPELTIAGVPYLYDPTLGNLLLDVSMTQTGTGGVVYLDVDDTCSGQVGRVYGSTGSGSVDCGGLVTEFDGVEVGPTAVPEPASIALFATGLTGLAGIGRRRRKSRTA